MRPIPPFDVDAALVFLADVVAVEGFLSDELLPRLLPTPAEPATVVLMLRVVAECDGALLLKDEVRLMVALEIVTTLVLLLRFIALGEAAAALLSSVVGSTPMECS